MDNKSSNIIKRSSETPNNGAEVKNIPEKVSKVDLEAITTSGDAKQMVEALPGVETSVDQEGGAFSEQQASNKGKGLPSAQTTATIATKSSISAQPSIQEMIKQTVEAIESELKLNEVEMKSLMRNQKTPLYLINDKAKKIRFLNGILSQLKRAAQLAEDFIVGLWKQYVNRV